MKKIDFAFKWLTELGGWAMEQKKSVTEKKDFVPQQRKTTLKWSNNGELSAIDMARVLDRLKKSELTECDLACSIEKEE